MRKVIHEITRSGASFGGARWYDFVDGLLPVVERRNQVRTPQAWRDNPTPKGRGRKN
jgi:hypothetical protein